MAGNSILTTGNTAINVEPAFGEFFGLKTKELPNTHEKVFDRKVTSDGSYYESVLWGGTYQAGDKPEGAPVAMGGINALGVKVWRAQVFAQGVRISAEAIADSVRMDVVKAAADDLAKAINTVKESTYASIFDNAFSTTYNTGADAVALCSSSHVTNTGTSSNLLSSAASLTPAAMEQLYITMRRCPDASGRPQNLAMRTLLVPPELEFVAKKIKETSGPNRSTAFTSNNDRNILGEMDWDVVVWPFLTNTTQYFVLTDADDGLARFEKTGVEMERGNDMTTKSLLMISSVRFAPIWSNFNAVMGVQATT